MKDPLRLAELMAVRLCHDLSSPLGTLMGALELASEDVESSTEALRLANDVSATMGKRLRLLRAAWGGATSALAVAELHCMAEGVQRGRRVQLDFEDLDPAGRFTPVAARLALNVLMLAMESLPGGGLVALSGDAGGDVLVTINGPRAAWPAGLAGFLADEAMAWEALRNSEGLNASRRLQPLLTALLAHAGGLRLSMLMSASLDVPPPLLMRLGEG
jgi:histidine phosphotransferase ChpT